MRTRLATPGPTEVPQRLLLAGARESIHHRSAEMEALLRSTNATLPRLFKTDHDVYTSVASGTGAMEAAVANLFSAGERVLVISNGYFGERFASIARAYGVEPVLVESPWGTSIDPERVAAAFRANPDIRGVMVVYSETSTGALNDVEAIGRIFAETDVVVVVDAISGLISHDLDMDGWGLDVVLAASHKGFMLPPGLTFIAISDRAWAKVDSIDAPTYYWSFKRLRAFHPMPPSSPAVSLQLALHESLDMLMSEGLVEIQARQRLIGEATMRALTAIGFTPFVREPDRRNYVVTAVLAPEGVNTAALLDVLSTRYSVTMTGGQGEYAGKLLRVGHVGAVDQLDMAAIVAAVELSLLRLGHGFSAGAATGALIAAFDEAERETASC